MVRREAEALAERARTLRTTAKNRLKAALEGNPGALNALSKEQPEKATPQQLPDLLGKLAARGRALREDEDLVLLADDAALTPDFLASLDELANELTEKVQETFKASGTNDSSLTNPLEGRVLRELAYLCDRVTNARKEGITIASVPLPRSVRSASRRK